MAEGSSCNYSPNRKEKTDQMDAAARSKKDKEVVEIVKEQLEACKTVISDILNRVVKNEEKETQQLRLAAQNMTLDSLGESSLKTEAEIDKAANKLQKAIDKLRKETNRLMRLQTSLKSTKEALASLTERLNVLQMEMNDDENIEQLPESARTVGNNVADVQQGNRDNGCLCLFCGQVIKRTYHLLHFHAHILSHFKDVADVQQVNPDKDRLCLFCGQIIKRPHRLVDFHVHVLSHFKDEDVK